MRQTLLTPYGRQLVEGNASGPVKDLRIAAGVVGLMLIASGPANSIDANVGNGFTALAGFLAVLVSLDRLYRAPRLAFWLVVLNLVFVFGNVESVDPSTGVRHILTTMSASGALLLFSVYGKEMIGYRWFRWTAIVLVAVGIAAAFYSFQVDPVNSPKNITGGTVLYLFALFVAIKIATARRGVVRWFLLFFLATGALALVLGFRALLGYAIVLLLGYLGAASLPKRLYWLAGILGAVVLISATIWYFLNAYTNNTAILITQFVNDESGRRATSGRDVLWPAIVQAVAPHPIWGLGTGALPQDILDTTLSSHSYYLQVYLQRGLVGLGSLLALLLSTWRTLAGSRQRLGWFGAAVFLMFVTHNATEVLMFQNGLIAGIPAWCAIGLAMSVAIPEQRAARQTALEQRELALLEEYRRL